LIVVDDGSKDGAAESLERWRDGNLPPFDVEILRGEHRGAAAARNRGIEAASDSEFLAFLDSDDLWPDDFLERTRGTLACDSSAVAASCDLRLVKLRTRETKLRDLRALAQDATTWLFLNNAAIASATLFRAEYVRRLGGFSEAILTGEDTELFLRVSVLGPWCHAEGEPVTMIRGSAEEVGEQRNLSESFADSHRQWVEVLESFVAERGGGEFIQARYVRRVLARRWHRAGRQLMHAGRVAEARDCFRRSCTWRKWNRAWVRLALAHLRAAN
jgi:glycosyltransferase involved in cell wall biosynthesis